MVLIVVIAATASIFGTVSRITAVGEANASIMTEAATIQRLIQEDIARLNPRGFFAIRNVQVRNDINPGKLINPMLDPQAMIRCDQLVFFRDGLAAAQTSRLSNDDAHKGQATIAMVYWGHGWQFPDGEAFIQDSNANRGRAHDPFRPVNLSDNGDLNQSFTPWYAGDAETVRTQFSTVNSAQGQIFSTQNSQTFNCVQPECRRWLLCRQQVALGDDDSQAADHNSKTVFMAQNQTARSVFFQVPAVTGAHSGFASRQIRDGRVDMAASRLNDIREMIARVGWSPLTQPPTLTPYERWVLQREFIVANVMRYPRAERVAPSMHRVDQALTNHVLGVACSSFRVDWTWAPGTGAATDPNGVPYQGFKFGPGVAYTNAPESQPVEQPWFGLTNPDEGVFPGVYANLQAPPPNMERPWWVMPGTVWIGNSAPTVQTNWADPSAIERYNWVPPSQGGRLNEYRAIFGFNDSNPVRRDDDPTSATYGQYFPDADLNYTPWPSAIRITMTLHDIDLDLEHGRVVQFVVPLPKRFDS